MASAFVFTHARRASEAQALEALRRDLLERGRARFKSVLRAEAALRDKAAGAGSGSGASGGGAAQPAGTPSAARLRPLRGCVARWPDALMQTRHCAPRARNSRALRAHATTARARPLSVRSQPHRRRAAARAGGAAARHAAAAGRGGCC
jgi:hypothetical protein